VKAGAGSPENFLAYADFDNTSAGRKPLHHYTRHLAHYRAGDPTWKNGKGKAIVGALNYLASKKMNSLYFLTMNVAGDGDDVFPWTAKSERYRYDVSKLAQWEIVFEHMDKLGIHLHMVTQEQENDQLLDRGALGVQRKLYYRELVARFSHHLGLTWNLGEESTNTTAQRESFADYINALDPYLHLIAVHTFPQDHDKVYTPILGHDVIGAASLQVHSPSIVHTETLKWVDKSADTGRKWIVAVDEIGGASVGVKPDANDAEHRVIAHRVLWGSLLAGAAGVEWYFGYDYAHDDLTCEDWTTRENMWTLTHHAAQFVRDYLPLPLVGNYNAITSATGDYCFGKPGVAYAIYLPAGATTSITLPAGETYTVEWFDPRKGGGLRNGTVATVSGGGAAAIGRPPADTSLDWVALLRRSGSAGGEPEPEKPAPTLAIAELMLVNAKTQADVRPLTDGAIIDLSVDGAVLNVRAAVNGSAGSVAFYLNGKKTLENTAPWTMAGDLNGVFQPWKPAVGRHTLRVVPYSRSNGGGEAGETLEISFTVIAVAPPTTEPPPAPEPENPATLALAEFVLVDAANQR
ncbi:MAG TPA: hypothetical protein VEA63_01165, partial [Opitutus sp.]|nr:hypothetical protein [Opitutus sp.]